MIELCLGSRGFPAEDVAAGALGPRVRRAAVQMEAMGLWRSSLDPPRLHLNDIGFLYYLRLFAIGDCVMHYYPAGRSVN